MPGISKEVEDLSVHTAKVTSEYAVSKKLPTFMPAKYVSSFCVATDCRKSDDQEYDMVEIAFLKAEAELARQQSQGLQKPPKASPFSSRAGSVTGSISNESIESSDVSTANSSIYGDKVDTARPITDDVHTAASRTLVTGEETSDPVHTADSRTLVTGEETSDPAITGIEASDETSINFCPDFTGEAHSYATGAETTDPGVTALTRTYATGAETSDPGVTAVTRTYVTGEETTDPAHTACSRSYHTGASRSYMTGFETSDPGVTAVTRTYVTGEETSDPAVTAHSTRTLNTADVVSERAGGIHTANETSDPVFTADSRSYHTANLLSDRSLTADTVSTLANTCASRSYATGHETSAPDFTAVTRTYVTGEETSDPIHTALSKSGADLRSSRTSDQTTCDVRTATSPGLRTARSSSRLVTSISTSQDNLKTAKGPSSSSNLKTARETFNDTPTENVETAKEISYMEMLADFADMVKTAIATSATNVFELATAVASDSEFGRPSAYILTHTPNSDPRAALAVPSIDDTITAVEQ